MKTTNIKPRRYTDPFEGGISQRIQEYEDEIARITEQYDLSREEVAQLAGDAADLNTLNKLLNDTVAQYKNREEFLNDKYNRTVSQYERGIKERNTIISNLEKTIRGLNDKYNRTVSQYERVIREKEDRIRELEGQIESLTGE